MRGRVIAVLVVVLVVGMCWLARGVLINADGGPEVPPPEQMPPVPPQATATPAEKFCASGGCWLQQELLPAQGRTPQELAERMGLTEETCGPLDLLNLRSVCTGSDVVNDRLVVYLRYESPVAE